MVFQFPFVLPSCHYIVHIPSCDIHIARAYLMEPSYYGLRPTFNRNLAPNFFQPGRSINFHKALETFSAYSTSSNTIVYSSEIALFGAVSSRSYKPITSSVATRSGAIGFLPKKKLEKKRHACVAIERNCGCASSRGCLQLYAHLYVLNRGLIYRARNPELQTAPRRLTRYG